MKRKIIAFLTTISLLALSTSNVFATSITEGGISKVAINGMIGSTFQVTMPSEFELTNNGVSGFDIYAEGDIATTQTLTIDADSTVTLTSAGKTDQTVSISVDKTSYTSNELSLGGKSTVTCTTPKLSAGKWSGSLSINIGITGSDIPQGSVTAMNLIQVDGTGFKDAKTSASFSMRGINYDNGYRNPSVPATNESHSEYSYKEIKAMGFNTIRYAIHYDMIAFDSFYDWLDQNIEWATEAGLYLVLDMHTSQGGRQLEFQEAAYEFWTLEELRQEFIDTWVELATHCAGNKTIMMYDLLNEPEVIVDEGTNPEEVYADFIFDLVKAIREVDSETILCAEMNTSAIVYNKDFSTKQYVNAVDGFGDLSYLNDDNVVLDMHNYSPPEYNFQTNEKPVSYEEVYTVENLSWNSNSYHESSANPNYYIVQEGPVNEWFEVETGLFQLLKDGVPADSNYSNVQYTIEDFPVDKSIIIDNIIIEEYNEQQQYMGIVYNMPFSLNAYGIEKSGNYNVTTECEGFDGTGTALKFTATQEDTQSTVQIENSGFTPKKGHYYNIKFKAKSDIDLSVKKYFRVRLLGANVDFAGDLKEYADFAVGQWRDLANTIGFPFVCNEFGINYNAIHNSKGDVYYKDIIKAFAKYNISFNLFSYSGFDFGLMYDNCHNFDTGEETVRQETYELTWKMMHDDFTTYAHIFKNVETMQKHLSLLDIGEKILVLGETLPGVGSQLVYTVTENGLVQN